MCIFSLWAREIFGYVPKAPPEPIEIPISSKDFVDWYKDVGMPEEVVSVRVLFEYQDISQILKSWKYEGNETSRMIIQEAFESALNDIPILSKNFFVSCVPLGVDRWYERWFNQSGYLSNIVRNKFWIPQFRGLYRLWSGQHQAWISKNKRVDRSFTFGVFPFFRVPEQIILVDDVISTWSTLQACVRCLIERGCKKVCIIALARSA